MRIENPASRWDWDIRDWFALATIPLIFLIDFVTYRLGEKPEVGAFIDSALRLGLMTALIWFYKPIFAAHWQRFKLAPFRGTAVVIIGAVLMQMVLPLVRALLPVQPAGAQSAGLDIDPMTAEPMQMALLFFLTLGPLAIVVVEETVFRHTLLFKVPVFSSKVWAALLVIANGALFGLIHYYNFGSVIGTIPFMVVGALFNLIYLWTRNIYHVLLMHLINNAAISTIALVFLCVMRAIS